MKLSEAAQQIGITEDHIRTIAIGIGQEIPANKSVISKAFFEDIKKNIPSDAQADTQVDAQEKETLITDPNAYLVPPVVCVKNFAEIINVPATQVISELVKNGFMITINENIDFEIAALIAEELEVSITLDAKAKETHDFFAGDLKNLLEEDKKNGSIRPPVVSVMGHVDHGKTSLLDAYRQSDVVSLESGGITQSIGAYQTKINDRLITFIDTPGHEAFIAMRRRGVQATDIAILVVAANESVKSQTIEAISHAQQADIPIIVAITKCDLADANIEKVKTDLAEHNLLSEEWGGDIMMIEVSTKTKQGLDDLLESVLLMADVAELKANPDRPAVGSVIESNVDINLGKIATVLIHTGTIKIRDSFVIGAAYGKVRTLLNDHSKQTKKAVPSEPILITGLNSLPEVGDILKVVTTEKEAKALALDFEKKRADNNEQNKDLSLDFITSRVKEESFKGIRVVLKTDTLGSLEAVKEQLATVKTDNARIKIIRARTGNISQSDIILAESSGAHLVGFSVNFASPDVEKEAKQRNIRTHNHSIIYKLVEELGKVMLESLEPEFEDVDLGVLEVKKVFLTEKNFMIVGGKITEGEVEKNAKVKVYRADKQVATSEISKVQRGTSQVKQVVKGDECGVQFQGKFRVKEGDNLHFYKTVEKKFELQ